MYASPPTTGSLSIKCTSTHLLGWIAYGETAGSQRGGVQVCMCWGGGIWSCWLDRTAHWNDGRMFLFLLLWIESHLIPHSRLEYWLSTLWAATLSNTVDCDTKLQRPNDYTIQSPSSIYEIDVERKTQQYDCSRLNLRLVVLEVCFLWIISELWGPEASQWIIKRETTNRNSPR